MATTGKALMGMALIVLIGASTNEYLCAGDRPPPIPAQEQAEVLTRGPVHEAFAEPVPLEVQAGLIVTSRPPANIEEIPPAERPRGEQFAWVPGYWGWDADRNDFVWVTACWRAVPPNTYWVPGYWAKVADAKEVRRGGVDIHLGGGFNIHLGGERRAVAKPAGWEWVSGFWAPVGAREIEYLPAPPATLDLEPPGPPPTAHHMWVPGCWYWQDDQYARRPGYWLRHQPGWVWEPSHYRWTPRGYVFEAGHWDYPLDRRGVLFAPVYFPRSVHARRGFSYSPSIVIDLGVLSAHLFAYPRYGHYYFGDYYDDAYLRAGIYPRFESQRRHTWYDPIYTYDRWHFGRADKRWEEKQRQEYDHRRSDRHLRPARTYREMETRVARMPKAQRRNHELARPLRTLAGRQSGPVRYERVNADTRRRISRQATDAHRFRDERVKWESRRATHPDAAKPRVERGDPRTPTAKRTPVPIPPRQVRLTRPERVRVPVPPPIVGKTRTTPGDVKKGPPPRPIDERKLKSRAKGAPKADGNDRDAKKRKKDKDTEKDEADRRRK